jgi:hypothetical protein
MTVPTRRKTVPLRRKLVPSGGNAVPSRRESVPQRREGIPSLGEGVPSRGERHPDAWGKRSFVSGKASDAFSKASFASEKASGAFSQASIASGKASGGWEKASSPWGKASDRAADWKSANQQAGSLRYNRAPATALRNAWPPWRVAFKRAGCRGGPGSTPASKTVSMEAGFHPGLKNSRPVFGRDAAPSANWQSAVAWVGSPQCRCRLEACNFSGTSGPGRASNLTNQRFPKTR